MENINGIIVINKEKGYTSHDVVAKVRGILSTKKVGHTGTLDPEATGVLPVCVGSGTKVSDMLTFSDKEYIASVRLGIETDTQDIWGKIVAEKKVTDFSEDALKEAITHFVGEIMQVPPMYSAIKINGKKMYDLARDGIEVERQPRKITIYNIDILSVSNDEFSLKVKCSKGTYIRTLCHDIGKYLGYGACMTSLCRTQSSIFNLAEAITLDELSSLVSDGRLCEALRPVDSVFTQYKKFVADEEISRRIQNGAESTVTITEGIYRVYDTNGEFIALGKVKNVRGRNKIFLEKYFGQRK